jgi:hypothetical protein
VLNDQILTPTPTPKSLSRVTSNAAPDGVPVIALRGDVESTGRADLVGRVLVPIEHTSSAPLVHLYHQGHGEMLDHMLVTRNPLAHYHGSEIHNEIGGRMDLSDLVVQDIIRHDRGPKAVLRTPGLSQRRKDARHRRERSEDQNRKLRKPPTSMVRQSFDFGLRVASTSGSASSKRSELRCPPIR